MPVVQNQHSSCNDDEYSVFGAIIFRFGTPPCPFLFLCTKYTRSTVGYLSNGNYLCSHVRLIREIWSLEVIDNRNKLHQREQNQNKRNAKIGTFISKCGAGTWQVRFFHVVHEILMPIQVNRSAVKGGAEVPHIFTLSSYRTLLRSFDLGRLIVYLSISISRWIEVNGFSFCHQISIQGLVGWHVWYLTTHF